MEVVTHVESELQALLKFLYMAPVGVVQTALNGLTPKDGAAGEREVAAAVERVGL